MKITKLLMTLIALLIILSGCSGAPRIIESKLDGKTAGVFKELKESEKIPPGSAVLRISSGIKTHLEGFYILEGKKSPHGKPACRFLVNIDGQTAIWDAEGKIDRTPRYDERLKPVRDPEAGNGMRYVLDKKLVLLPGLHRIFFALPDEKYCREFEVSLTAGVENAVELTAVYNKRRPFRKETFMGGLKKYDVYLNGVIMAD